ncbi:alpha/beta hydrolase [Streptomyces sp. NBC_00647]|uniref:alpha/beta fold hydrolase n=1 Tax=Streptomyces sp. NBC_00647 TaxID=2975796 RepID=UPI003255467E
MTRLSLSTGAGVFDAIVAGPPGGRPVLLHGLPQTGLVWKRRIAASAAHGYRVVAPDQQGYSPGARPSDYRISVLVDDVVATTEELGWAAFDLVGHDRGGAAAWWTAHSHPGRVRTLPVASTPHPGALTTTLRTDQDQRKRAHCMIDGSALQRGQNPRLAGHVVRRRRQTTQRWAPQHPPAALLVPHQLGQTRLAGPDPVKDRRPCEVDAQGLEVAGACR